MLKVWKMACRVAVCAYVNLAHHGCLLFLSALPGKLGDYEEDVHQPGYYKEFPQFQLLPDSLRVLKCVCVCVSVCVCSPLSP